MSNVWLALIAGLTSGGISCFAIQGGLLGTTLSNNKDKSKNWLIILTFLITKSISYFVFGLILGSLGTLINIPIKAQAIFQLFIGLFIIASAANLANIHPLFRYFVVQPPKFLYKLVHKSSHLNNLFVPIILGALTIFIPCGTTQAMMLLSISSGSALFGGLILFAFILGTFPVFFTLGLASNEIFKRPALKYFAASVLVIIGLSSINSSLILLNSPHTLQNYYFVIKQALNGKNTENGFAPIKDGVQEVSIQVTSNGYYSNIKKLKQNIPVRLKITTNKVYSCSRAFTIPSLNLSRLLADTGVEYLTFTPTQVGRLTYSCSMGMYSNWFEVEK